MKSINLPVAVVTGASRGIGRAVALRLAEEKYQVALLARNEVSLNEVKTIIERDIGSHAEIFPVDLTQQQSVEETFRAIHNHYQRIDVLFNNAGILRYGTSEATLDDLDSMIEINLRSAIYVIQQVVPQMKKQGSGYIFNLASRAGKMAPRMVGAYAATKFALVGYNEALYQELMPDNIRVTALCPSCVATDMMKQNAKKGSLPLNEMIQVEDLATTVSYLLRLSMNASVKEVVIDCRSLEVSRLNS